MLVLAATALIAAACATDPAPAEPVTFFGKVTSALTRRNPRNYHKRNRVRKPTATTTTTSPAATSTTTTEKVAPTTTTATTTTTRPPVNTGSRDLFTWPFAVNSIWNTPIGSGAQLVPAGLTVPGNVQNDQVRIIRSNNSDPYRPIYNTVNYFGGGRCNSREATGLSVRVPDSLYIGDARPGYTPNSIVTLVDMDGRKIRSLGAVARCLRDANGREPGQPGYGAQPIDYNLYAVPADDVADGQSLTGPGTYGAHFGSFLSGMGGHLRPGELTGTAPIRHALAINLWGKANLYYDRSLSPASGQLRGAGYRWPALQADSYAGQSDGYHGSNPATVMGALLTLPAGVTAESLGVTSAVGRKLFDAFRDYGAYVVDDSYWDSADLGMDDVAMAEFQSVTGREFGSGPERADVQKIIAALHVVDNNGPSSIGGGGTPRAPLAPPI